MRMTSLRLAHMYETCGPYVVTILNQTPLFEGAPIWQGLSLRLHNTCYYNDETLTSRHKSRSTFPMATQSWVRIADGTLHVGCIKALFIPPGDFFLKYKKKNIVKGEFMSLMSKKQDLDSM